MKVIFNDSGKIQDVPDGYGRNYLIPKGLAIVATDLELKRIEERKKNESEEEKKKRESAILTAKKLDGKLVTVSKKTGPDGKLFGSVTAREISEAINSQLGIRIDKHNIKLDDLIKKVGEYEIKVDLGMGVKAILNIQISI